MTPSSQHLNDWCMAAQFAAHAVTLHRDGVRRYLHVDNACVKTHVPSCAIDLYLWDNLADQGFFAPSECVFAYERPKVDFLPDLAHQRTFVDIHFVYRFYDVMGRLIYIGMTNDPGNRRAQHRQQAEFAHHVDPAKTTYEYWPSRESAADRERAIIGLEGPMFNVTYNG